MKISEATRRELGRGKSFDEGGEVEAEAEAEAGRAELQRAELQEACGVRVSALPAPR